MKTLMIALTALCGMAAVAIQAPTEASAATVSAVTTAGTKTNPAAVSEKDRRDAVRYGYAPEAWCALSKKARKEIRQEALARKKGMTVAEMKVEANRKAAEKVGCPVDRWAKMSVKERCAYRKQAKAQKN